MVETENLLIDALQKMDLNYEEAQIYFTLLKYGKSGTIVRKLREELSYIERTTIYSILRRLIEKGCVHEEKSSNESKRLEIITGLHTFKSSILPYASANEIVESFPITLRHTCISASD